MDTEVYDRIYKRYKFERLVSKVALVFDVALLWLLYSHFGTPWWWWAFVVLIALVTLGAARDVVKLGEKLEEMEKLEKSTSSHEASHSFIVAPEPEESKPRPTPKKEKKDDPMFR